MLPRINSLCLNYGIGAFGGAFTVIVLWVLSVSSQFDVSLFPTKLGIEYFYMPVFWGGVWGMAYALPLTFIRKWKGIFLSIFPALTFMFFNFLWVEQLFTTQEGFSYLLRGDSVTIFIVYAICWGMLTDRLLRRA